MRALTVRQPYASRLVRGEKRVENRGRHTNIRGRLIIHSAADIHEHYLDEDVDLPISSYPRSSLVGTVQLVDVHNAEVCPSQEWCARSAGFRPDGTKPIFHWVVEDPREFVTPIPRIRGYLGFWDPEPSALYLAEIAEIVGEVQS